MVSALLSSALAQRRSLVLSMRSQLALLLLLHVLLWTWIGIASRSNFDTPGDMVEAYAWAQSFEWGYYKHPPLSAWVAGLWFAVVPESHAGYSLLAAVNGAVGLAGLAWLAREFLPGRWVLLVVAAASLTPGISTLSMRFNANAILIATWPWATALFVRWMQRGRPLDAVLCGLACALAMLGKYYSGVLLASLLVSALCLPAWRLRLRQPAFALALAVLAVALAPHVNWLLGQVSGPLQYAQDATGVETRGDSLLRSLRFALSMYVFPLLAFIVLGIALDGPARHRAFWQALSAPLRPRGDVIWLLAILPVIGTMLATLLTAARTASVWGLAISAGLALLAASRARDAGAEVNLSRLWRTIGVIAVAAAVLAPSWWLARAALATPAVAEPREELARALDDAWTDEFGTALPWVSGTRALAASAAFYADDHPRYWSLWNAAVETPWVDTAEVSRRGGIIVCERRDEACQALAENWSADRRRLRVAKSARGFIFQPTEYVFYLMPPSPWADLI